MDLLFLRMFVHMNTTGWWFQIFLSINPELGGRYFFLTGLKSPPRNTRSCDFVTEWDEIQSLQMRGTLFFSNRLRKYCILIGEIW